MNSQKKTIPFCKQSLDGHFLAETLLTAVVSTKIDPFHFDLIEMNGENSKE